MGLGAILRVEQYIYHIIYLLEYQGTQGTLFLAPVEGYCWAFCPFGRPLACMHTSLCAQVTLCAQTGLAFTPDSRDSLLSLIKPNLA